MRGNVRSVGAGAGARTWPTTRTGTGGVRELAHARERKERGNVKVRIKGYAKRLTCAISFVIHAISASVEEKRCNARRYLTQ